MEENFFFIICILNFSEKIDILEKFINFPENRKIFAGNRENRYVLLKKMSFKNFFILMNFSKKCIISDLFAFVYKKKTLKNCLNN